MIDDWNGYYVARTKAVMDGSWKSGDTWGGMNDGMVEMAPFTNMPDDVKPRSPLKTRRASWTARSMPSRARSRTRDGQVVVKVGERVSDEDLLKMNWYVEGVDDELPE